MNAAPTDPAARPFPRRAARSLRVRLALASALAAAIALLGAGVVVVTSIDRSERSSLDATLRARVDRGATVARDALDGPAGRGAPGAPAAPGGTGGSGAPGGSGSGAPGGTGNPGGSSGSSTGGAAAAAPTGATPRLLGPADQRLGDEVAIVRVVRAGTVTERLGSVADPGLPATASATPETVTAGGQPWRIVQREVASGLEIQAAAPLAPLEARARTLRDRVVVAGLGGVLATALLALVLVGAVLRALGRLRVAAADVAATADLSTRVDEDDGPQEVREVSATLNAMLARLERADGERRIALEATRRFAADAGHELRTPLSTIGAGVQTVADHPELSPEERAEALADVLREHRRAVALLEALQALARGDAAGRLEREPVDLVDVAEAAIETVRPEAPGHDLRLTAPEALGRELWAPGVRLAIENLVRNAVLHGRPGGSVVVTVDEAGGAARVTVDDDGPGIPAGERDAVRARFARGAAATASGSGLGLALVEQQATIHGGRLELGDAPAGGLRARLVLPNGG